MDTIVHTCIYIVYILVYTRIFPLGLLTILEITVYTCSILQTLQRCTGNFCYLLIRVLIRIYSVYSFRTDLDLTKAQKPANLQGQKNRHPSKLQLQKSFYKVF